MCIMGTILFPSELTPPLHPVPALNDTNAPFSPTRCTRRHAVRSSGFPRCLIKAFGPRHFFPRHFVPSMCQIVKPLEGLKGWLFHGFWNHPYITGALNVIIDIYPFSTRGPYFSLLMLLRCFFFRNLVITTWDVETCRKSWEKNDFRGILKHQRWPRWNHCHPRHPFVWERWHLCTYALPTVDGRNPAPPGMYKTLKIIG